MSKEVEQFYNDLEERKSFCKLTSTGISNDFKNVFEFAEAYHQSRVNAISDECKSFLEEQLMNLGEDELDDVSWGMEYGVLIKGKHAKEILQLLNK